MRDLSSEQRERLARRYGRRFHRGDVIFREGQPAEEAYWLQEGSVRLVKRMRGVEKALMIVHEHDLYGETALLSGAVRGATAIAVDDGLHLVLQRDTLKRILEGNSMAAMRLILQLIRRLSEAQDHIELMMVGDAHARIVGAVLKLGNAVSQGREGPVSLKVSPMELSERLGMDINTVKAGIKKLREQQYLRVVNETLEIPRLDALAQLYSLLTLKDEIRGGGISSHPPAAPGAEGQAAGTDDSGEDVSEGSGREDL